ncbi:MAG: hypothetical protein L6R37_006488 [Teloschistes peruensis]|nr:MAG: hypothetical protein L6R37_006488 [Teloschistes peruensis]
MAAIVRRQVPTRLSRLASPIYRPSQHCIAAPIWQSQTSKTPIPHSTRNFQSSTRRNEKKFTKDHEWIEFNDEKTQGTIGITQFAASALGDVVYVELPTIDLSVSAGDSIGAVESVKSASDIMTPVTGKIVATNETLESKPSLINQGPEGEGWIARIEVGEEGKVEIGGLMGADEYKEFTEEEGAKE